MAEGKELAGETVVKMPFLEEDLAQSNKRAYELVDQQKDDLQIIFDRISDLISLNVFSSEQFDTYMDEAESKRTKAIQMVNELDGDLLSEYAVTEEAQTYIFTLYRQLIEATRQGENISPLYFNAKAYKTSEIYQLKDDMDKKGNAYLTFRKNQKEERFKKKSTRRPISLGTKKHGMRQKPLQGKLRAIMIIREQPKALILSQDENCQQLNESQPERWQPQDLSQLSVGLAEP